MIYFENINKKLLMCNANAEKYNLWKYERM